MIRDWKELFDAVKAKSYSKTLHDFLDEEYAKGICYPPRVLVYNAFALTKPSELKVVIIGQDPYHNPGQAMGLSFSVPEGMDLPPSLVNIYKEIQNDLGVKMNFNNGDLTNWARQGTLLLNAYLSVRENQPLSHRCPEYEQFIQDVMEYLDSLDQPMVFMLWGSFAKRYAKTVHNPKHIIVACNHPSPLSANRGGWFGEKPFSKCNDYLSSNGLAPIDWRNQ